ncbi:MAG: leucine-rich repeat protein [Muribaculaceae bacterium]
MNSSTPKSMLFARPLALLLALLCMLAANAAVSVGSYFYVLLDGTTATSGYTSSYLFKCKVLTLDEANSTGTTSIELYTDRRYDYGKTGDNTVLDVPGTVEFDGVTFTTTTMRSFIATEYITEIKIPATVTTIEANTFQKGKALTTITIPGSVEVIGKYVFDQCAALESVTLNEGTTTVCEYAFGNCTALTSLTLPESVTTIEARFCTGSGVKTVNLPSGLTELPAYCFDYCSALESITLPDGITALPEQCFGRCDALHTVTLGPNLTEIGTNAFLYDESLATINTANVTFFGERCFDGCSALQSIDCAKATSLGNNAFSNTGFTAFTIPDGVTTLPNALLMNSKVQSMVIPDRFTAIPDRFLSGCSELTSVTLPANLTSIGREAFAGTAVAQFDLPNSITQIGPAAFAYNQALTSLCVPPLVVSFDGSDDPSQGIIFGCSNLTEVTFAEGSKMIALPSYFFAGTGVTEFVVPEGFVKIGKEALGENIAKVTLPSTLETIPSMGNTSSGYYGMNLGTGLQEIIVAAGNPKFKAVDGVLFSKDGTILYQYPAQRDAESYTIPEGVTSLGIMAFSNCANLQSVTCSTTMTAFGPAAFTESSLTTITIPGTIERIDEQTFQNCSSLANVTFEEGVKAIGSSAFSGCSALSSIAFPSTIESIESYSFSYSGLTSVTIRQNTKEVGASAFYYCSNLSSVSIVSSSTIIGEDAFAETKWMGNQPDGPVYLANRLISFKGEMEPNYTLNVAAGTVAIVAGAIPYSYTYKYEENLVAVTLPSSLQYIGDRAFSNSKITEVTIPDNVTYVGAGAFGWNLTGAVKVGKSVAYIGNQGCGRSLANITIASGNTALTKTSEYLYNAGTGHLFMADLGESTSASLPSSVKYFTDAYFCSDPSQLTSFSFGQNISNTDANGTEIKFGEFFQNFTGLTRFSVSEDNPYFSAVDGSLYNKDQTTLIAVPAGKSISTLTMPETVTRVDNMACANNSNITAVVLSSKCVTVGEGAFMGCSNLRDVDLGRDLQVLEEYAFYDCYALESLTLPTTFSLLGEMGGKSYLGNLKRLVIQSLGDISVYVGDYAPSVTLEYPCVTSLTVTGNSESLTTNAYDGVYVNGEFTRSDSYSTDYQSVPNALYFSTDPSQSGQENYVVVTNTPTTEVGTGGSEDPKDPGKKEVALRFHQRAKAPALSGVDAYCENLVLQDGVAFNSPVPFVAGSVSMDVDVDALWRTIAVPFACDVPEGVNVEHLDIGNEPTASTPIINFTSVYTMEPGVGYIICNKARTAVTLTATDVTIGQDLTPDGSALIGNISDPLALDADFRAQAENTGYNFFLYNPYTDNWDLQDTSGVVPTNQAYLRLVNTIPTVFTPYHNGVVSSVENISVDAPASDAVYDIYGRPVANPSAPGIYIINGKKVRIP